MPVRHALLTRVTLAAVAAVLSSGCVERTLSEQTTGSPYGQEQEQDLCQQLCDKFEPCDDGGFSGGETCLADCEDSRAQYEELRCSDVWDAYMRCIYERYECDLLDIEACTDEALAFADCFDTRPEPERPGPGPGGPSEPAP